MKLKIINVKHFKFKMIEKRLNYHSTRTDIFYSDELIKCVNSLLIFTR